MFSFLGRLMALKKWIYFPNKLKKMFGKEFQEQNKGGGCAKGLTFTVLESCMPTVFDCLCWMRCFTSVVRPEPQLLQVWFWWWRCWGRRPRGGCRFLLLCWSRGLSYPAGAETNSLPIIRVTVAVEGGHSPNNEGSEMQTWATHSLQCDLLVFNFPLCAIHLSEKRVG